MNKLSILDNNTEGVYIGDDGLAVGKTAIKAFSNGYLKLNDWAYFENNFTFNIFEDNHQQIFSITPNGIELTETKASSNAIPHKSKQQITADGILSTSPKKLLYCTSNESIQFTKTFDLIADATNTSNFCSQNMLLHYEFNNLDWTQNSIKLFVKEELLGCQLARTANITIYGGIVIPKTSYAINGLVGALDGEFLKFKNTTQQTITAGNMFIFGNIEHKFR